MPPKKRSRGRPSLPGSAKVIRLREFLYDLLRARKTTMGFSNTTDSAFAEILLLCSYNGNCKFANIVTQCNELCKIARFKYSRPIRVRHFTIARFQNKNKRLQRISDENEPLNLEKRNRWVCFYPVRVWW